MSGDTFGYPNLRRRGQLGRVLLHLVGRDRDAAKLPEMHRTAIDNKVTPHKMVTMPRWGNSALDPAILQRECGEFTPLLHVFKRYIEPRRQRVLNAILRHLNTVLYLVSLEEQRKSPVPAKQLAQRRLSQKSKQNKCLPVDICMLNSDTKETTTQQISDSK